MVVVRFITWIRTGASELRSVLPFMFHSGRQKGLAHYQFFTVATATTATAIKERVEEEEDTK